MNRKRRTVARKWQYMGLGALALVTAGAVGFATLGGQTPPPVPDSIGSAAATPPSFAVTPEPRTKPVVTFVGDSYTGGSAMGGNKENNYSAIVAEHFDWIGVNQGIGGTGYLAPGGGTTPLTFGSDKQLYKTKMLDRPSLIFIVDGVNDLAKPQTDLAAAVDKTIKDYAAAQPKSTVVVVGLIPPGRADQKFLQANQIIKAQAEKNGVIFWDPAAEEWLRGKPELVGSDKFHLNDAGHEYLAQIFIDRITATELDVKAKDILANWGATS